MINFIDIIKLKIKIFNLRFKISKISNILFFYGFFLSILFTFQIIQFIFGNYEKIYILKLFLLPTITIGAIFPNKNSIEKMRLKSFFGNFNQSKLDDFYLYKNYIFTLIFLIYILIPYNIEFLNTFLFCYSIWTLLLLIVLFIKSKFENISIDLIRLSLCIIPIALVNIFEIKLNIKAFSDSINFVFYIIFIFLNIFLSIKILKNTKKYQLNKKEFSKILIKNSFVGYNFLYIIRSRKFFSNLLIFYTNFIVFILKQNQKDTILTFLATFLAINFFFFYAIIKIEKNKMLFIFEKKYIKNLKFLKVKDLIKCSILFTILSFPAIYYKLRNLSLIFFAITILTITIFNIILINISEIKNFKLDKKFLNKAILIYFLLLFTSYYSIIKIF